VQGGPDREGGFTLIELMVVVLIIAVLIGIAIPTFLGARQRAQDRAAQSSLRNSLTAAKTIFTDAETYLNATDTALDSAEPSIDHVATGVASTGAKNVSVNPASAGVWYGAAKSASGTCFFVKDNVASPGADGTTFAKSTNACTGTQAALETYSSSW
jgi:type IV pilus assembly protein PilA